MRSLTMSFADLAEHARPEQREAVPLAATGEPLSEGLRERFLARTRRT
jgi:hypothetical protein